MFKNSSNNSKISLNNYY